MTYTGPPERQSESTSAVASSIWDMYEKGGKTVLPGETFDFLMIDCEVCITDNHGVQSCVVTHGVVCRCCVY